MTATNIQTEQLLSRFAAVDQRLEGTGAPGVPEWVSRFDLSNIDSMPKGSITGGVDGIDDDGDLDIEEHCYNPQACLAGCVMWAMEVAEWAYPKLKVRPCTIMVKYTPESWLEEIESIADAIGGG